MADLQVTAPQNFIAQIVGANLFFTWTPVTGRPDYQIYSASTAGPQEATLFQEAGGLASLTVPLNSSLNSQIITNNAGFETGDFSGYTNACAVPFTLSSSQNHTTNASYAAYISVTGSQSSQLDTVLYPIMASCAYTSSVWYYQAASSVLQLIQHWFDSTQTQIGGDNTVGTAASTLSAWTQISASSTSPSNAAYTRLRVYASGSGASGSGTETAHVDDFSMIGQSVVIPTTQLFAVRALDRPTGQASPFSPWQQPSQSPKAVGSPASAHMQVSYLAGGDISSVLSACAGIAQTAQGFTDTGWNVPLVSATCPVSETWTYVSGTSFSASGDSTTRYYNSVRLRMKQGGSYLYFVVTGASFSASTTTVSVLGVDGATIASSAITDNYYSMW